MLLLIRKAQYSNIIVIFPQACIAIRVMLASPSGIEGNCMIKKIAGKKLIIKHKISPSLPERPNYIGITSSYK